MQAIAAYAKQHGLHIEPMQDFIPLPMTLAGCMYATGLDPVTMQPLVVPKTSVERKKTSVFARP
jgi:hypothetical protein